MFKRIVVVASLFVLLAVDFPTSDELRAPRYMVTRGALVPCMPADVNCDGKIDLSDALLAKACIPVTQPAPDPVPDPVVTPATQPAPVPVVTTTVPVIAKPPTPLATLYVSPTGKDDNNGQQATPLATIQKAVSLAKAGTEIVLASGTYKEQIIAYNTNGTVDHPIVLRADTNATPVIDATGNIYGIRLFYAHYWIIEGVSIKNSNTAGLQAEDATGSIFRNITAFNNKGVGILVMASNNVSVEWCESYANGIGIKVTQEEIRLFDAQGNVTNGGGTVRSDYCSIKYCLAHDNLIAGGGSDGIDYNGGDHGQVTYNLVWQNYDDGIDNSSGGGGGNHSQFGTIAYNASWRNGPEKACPNDANYADCIKCPANGDCGNGAGIKTSTNAGGNNDIHHNVVFDNRLAGFDNDQEANWGPNRFYNNTAYGNAYNIALDMAGITNADSAALVKNNILAGSTVAGQAGGDLRPTGEFCISISDYNFIADGLFPQAEGTHSLVAKGTVGDPKLVNPKAKIDTNYTGTAGIPGKWNFIWNQVQNNFSVASDSPCIDKGVVISGVTDGFKGAAPDMGAIEAK